MSDLEKFKQLKPEQYADDAELIQRVIEDLEKGLAYYQDMAESMLRSQESKILSFTKKGL
jgi:hypothetical protein